MTVRMKVKGPTARSANHMRVRYKTSTHLSPPSVYASFSLPSLLVLPSSLSFSLSLSLSISLSLSLSLVPFSPLFCMSPCLLSLFSCHMSLVTCLSEKGGGLNKTNWRVGRPEWRIWGGGQIQHTATAE